MFPFLTKPIDRLVINLAAARLTKEPDFAAHAELAEALLESKVFFGSEVVGVPDLRFTSLEDFEFASPFESPWTSNNTVRGKLFPAGADWRSKPSVILIHGYNADPAYRGVMRGWANRLAMRGVNGVLMELPFHLGRRPRGREDVRDFLSCDLLAIAQATHQSLLDLRALIAWLKANGAPKVGLWGNSLGGWLEGLLVCHSDAVDCAAFLTPVSRMDRALVEIDFAALVRRAVEENEFDVSRLNLEIYKPRLPAEQMLLVVGRDDQFVPLETMQHLSEIWGGVETAVLPHGHISILMSEEAADRTANWFWDQM